MCHFARIERKFQWSYYESVLILFLGISLFAQLSRAVGQRRSSLQIFVDDFAHFYLKDKKKKKCKNIKNFRSRSQYWN